MDRLACVDLPGLPLQLLLRRHPEWQGLPVAVVDRDAPTGLVLWSSTGARAVRILPGMRYAAALALSRELRAGEVPAGHIAAEVAALVGVLRGFSPGVEPHLDEPGVFWLDARGLGRLFRSPAAWGRQIRAALAARGLRSRIAVGFTRFGTYAAARAGLHLSRRRRAVVVFPDADAEARAVREVPLAALGIPPALRDELAALGAHRVGELLALPAPGLAERFGSYAAQLHAMARGQVEARSWPAPPEPPLEVTRDLDDPEADLRRLLRIVGGALDELLARVERRGEVLESLTLGLCLERGGTREERLQPASPTRDRASLLELLQLRLEARGVGAGVTALRLAGVAVREEPEQLRLLATRQARALETAGRAVARLVAELGEGAVVRARLADGHLPGARFAWEPLTRPALPRPGPGRAIAVRRVRDHGLPLPGGPEPALGDLLGPDPVRRREGPHRHQGGWWGAPHDRDLHLLETEAGRILWVEEDRSSGRWRLVGWVE